MKRRKALLNTAGLAGISALTARNIFAAETKERFGDVIIPPEKELGI